MSLVSLCIMFPCILTEEINACIVLSIYLQIVSLLVYPITCNHCSLKMFFFSVPMKMFIISETSNCMNKVSSLRIHICKTSFFFVKVDILSILMIIRKGRLMIFCISYSLKFLIKK